MDRMLRYIVRRLLWLVVLLFAISILTFALFFILPSDPASSSAPRGATPEVVAQIRHRMGLDQPLWKQYLHFLHGPDTVGAGHPTGIFNWPPNFGYSFKNQQPVLTTIVSRLPVTASLTIGAAVFWLLMGIPIGILAALRPRSLRDRAATLFALVGVSAPTFLLGIVLLFVFYFKLRWFPGPGYTPLQQNPGQWAYQLFLPWLSLSVTNAAFYSRMVRGNMLEVAGEDYVRTARAKGLPEWRVVVRHILRASLTPVVTMLGLDIGILLGGAVVTEKIFGLPGIGAMAIGALTDVDLPVIVGTVMFAAFFIMLFNLLVDIAYAALDPRVRYS
jgi:peptide/nickel transport system permease protein